ncbi:MAG: IclR family transcriptional regulator [Pseudomonadota bacterium]
MSSESRIPTNLRTLLILEIIGRSDRALTATEINQELRLPKQTVHRLCTTLEKEGFIYREPNGKRLLPSARTKNLASGILFSSRGNFARRQVLLDIANKTSETVNLVIPEDDGMMYLDRVETDWPFRIQLPVGSHVPFHCTASGKTFLASLSPARRRAMIRNLKLTPKTANTHTVPEELMAELSRVAKQGYAIDNEEFMNGMVALAVPVMDRGGRYCASIAFHGPTQRLTVESMLEQLETLLSGAERLSDVFFQ